MLQNQTRAAIRQPRTRARSQTITRAPLASVFPTETATQSHRYTADYVDRQGDPERETESRERQTSLGLDGPRGPQYRQALPVRVKDSRVATGRVGRGMIASACVVSRMVFCDHTYTSFERAVLKYVHDRPGHTLALGAARQGPPAAASGKVADTSNLANPDRDRYVQYSNTRQSRKGHGYRHRNRQRWIQGRTITNCSLVPGQSWPKT